MAISDRSTQSSDSSINVSMGDVNSSQVVTGKDNRVAQTINNVGGDAVSMERRAYVTAKEALLAAIRDKQTEIPDAEDLPDFVNGVDEEIQKEKPNKTIVRSLLESLYSRVDKVAGVAVKVNALKAAVSMLIGL